MKKILFVLTMIILFSVPVSAQVWITGDIITVQPQFPDILTEGDVLYMSRNPGDIDSLLSVRVTNQGNDGRFLGTFICKTNPWPGCGKYDPNREIWRIRAPGVAIIRVTDSAKDSAGVAINVAVGDLLCPSATKGMAQLQVVDGAKSYTVTNATAAKSFAVINWANVNPGPDGVKRRTIVCQVK